MKTEQAIREQIAKLEADERYSYPPAQVQINAPLALIQVELEAKVQTLKWVLRTSAEESPPPPTEQPKGEGGTP
jgi:hypothetical protein